MRTLIASLVLAALAAAAPVYAQSADFGIPAHISRVDGRALIEREDGSDEAERNLTLAEGDRIRTESGRVEVLFADGTLLHLDRNTVVDFQREDFVRVLEGRARWFVARGARGILRVDTPAATLELDPGGEYRVRVAPNGDAELAVVRGSGAMLNDHGDTDLRAGERAVTATGRAPSQALYMNAAFQDEFDLWSDRQRRTHGSTVSVRYLPNELHPYGAVFDSYGSWRSHPTHGYVWYPVAGSGWQPYSRGRWHSYPRYGWTWIGSDPWAWPTHHFGRWGFSAGVWFWIPGRTWGPAWVAWANAPGYVGWSPLGWNDHPIYRVNVYNSYSAGYPWCGWTFIRDRQFGGRWGTHDVFIGAGVSVVARGGIVPSVSSPTGRRAVPRGGVASGTAVPRGTGSAGQGGARPGDTGLAGVATSRPRRIPTETIRSGGSGVATPRSGASGAAGSSDEPRATPSRTPREATPRTSEPRTSEPRTGESKPTQPAAGRPAVRRPSGGGDPETSSAYQAPDNGRAARRAQPRDQDQGASAPYAAPPQAERPSYGSRRAAPREAERPQPSAPAVRGAEPRQRSAPPSSRPEPSSRPAPSARPEPSSRREPASRPSPSSGGGGAVRGGDRRAPTPATSGTGGQAQSRRRGGG